MTGWRGLLLGVTIIHLLNGVALTLLAGTLYPTYVVFPVLWIIGILRLRRGGRAGLLWLGITGLAFLLLHLPLTLPELSNPTQLFVPTVIYNVASVYRGSRPGAPRAPRDKKRDSTRLGLGVSMQAASAQLSRQPERATIALGTMTER